MFARLENVENVEPLSCAHFMGPFAALIALAFSRATTNADLMEFCKPTRRWELNPGVVLCGLFVKVFLSGDRADVTTVEPKDMYKHRSPFIKHTDLQAQPSLYTPHTTIPNIKTHTHTPYRSCCPPYL